jgi:hypothetical protein
MSMNQEHLLAAAQTAARFAAALFQQLDDLRGSATYARARRQYEEAFAHADGSIDNLRAALDLIAPEAVEPMNIDIAPVGARESGAITIWRQKLAFFRTELRKTGDAAQRFSITSQIRECAAKINELAGYTPQPREDAAELEHLLREEALTCDPSQKFSLAQRIATLRRTLGKI